MRRLVEGKDSESDCDEEDQDHDEQQNGQRTDTGLATDRVQEEEDDENAADKRYERLQRLQEQATAAARQAESEERARAALLCSSPLPAAALALPRGRWDDLPRIPAAPWQPMSVSGAAALSDVMAVLSTSFNAAGVCVGLAEWAGHAVVAVGAAPVLGRAELCWQLAQLPLVKGVGTAKSGAPAARGGVELTLAPVENALAVYGVMCESREQQARSVRGPELDGLLHGVSEQHQQLAAAAGSSTATVAAPHRGVGTGIEV